MTGDSIAFDSFEVHPTQRALLRDGEPVRLGGRALDILLALIQRPGEVISNDELAGIVWPNITVAEGGLRVHIATLRKVLGDGPSGRRYIVNVPGRGYCFAAQVSRLKQSTASPDLSGHTEQNQSLPALDTPIIGREDFARAVESKLNQRRFVTIVGPGGIGKTKVALDIAHRLRSSYLNGVYFIDLAPIAKPELVPSAVAFVLGLPVNSERLLPGLVAYLRDKRTLVLLDNCEHVVDAAAELAEVLYKEAPYVHVLATSREALRAEGERVQRLSPLPVPSISAGLTAVEALSYPSVRLFVDRTAANIDNFQLSDVEAPIVGELCRRLDGIALAIELAAARVDAFGVRGLGRVVDNCFRVLTHGRRTALPRHQTLSAMLSWSYDLLTERERITLRRVAVFAGSFTLSAVTATAADDTLPSSEVLECVANLVGKSLLTADAAGREMTYRLLDTTRAYALEKLADSGEVEIFARRHAEFYLDKMQKGETERASTSLVEWLAVYSDDLGNIRIALDWAFSQTGDLEVAVSLTIAAVPLWMHLSLMEECRARVQQALESLGPKAELHTRSNMQLFAALGGARLCTKGPSPEINANWTSALAMAEHLGDADYQLRALWGLWVDSINNGDLRNALSLARRFKQVAAHASDPMDSPVGDRLIGRALHLLGEASEARKHLEQMLREYKAPSNNSHVIRFQFDQSVTAKVTLGEVLWLLGFPDQAMSLAATNADESMALNHAVTLCNVLGQGTCPVALFVGDLGSAERFVSLLLDQSTKYALPLWHSWGRCWAGVLQIKKGATRDGTALLRAALDDLPQARLALRYTSFLGELADGLNRTGSTMMASAIIDEALGRIESNEEFWCFSELLRIKGEILLCQSDSTLAAEAHFERALQMARQCGALSWELRVATSLARLWRDQGRSAEAREALASVYGRFTEGFGTGDLISARALLSQLEPE